MAVATYVALLRGVNVGGAHKLPMKMLAEICATAGCAKVQTYIQSGNVVFQAEQKSARRMAAAISASIEERFGFAAPIVLRTAEQLRGTIQHNPFLKAGADPATLHVMFLEKAPDAEALQGIDAAHFVPDEFALHGEDLYLRLPNGMGRAKLPLVLGSKLRTVGATTRNWRTVTKLLELMKG